ncbi:hypothetical protein MKX03_020008, partial [Papaver bracteatum]
KSNAEIQRLEANFEARDTKCRRLKKKLKVIVSNLTKDDIRIHDGTLKEEVGELCSQHHIPFPSHYEFVDPSDNEEASEISDSDFEYKDSDEEDHDSELTKMMLARSILPTFLSFHIPFVVHILVILQSF